MEARPTHCLRVEEGEQPVCLRQGLDTGRTTAADFARAQRSDLAAGDAVDRRRHRPDDQVLRLGAGACRTLARWSLHCLRGARSRRRRDEGSVYTRGGWQPGVSRSFNIRRTTLIRCGRRTGRTCSSAAIGHERRRSGRYRSRTAGRLAKRCWSKDDVPIARPLGPQMPATITRSGALYYTVAQPRQNVYHVALAQ